MSFHLSKVTELSKNSVRIPGYRKRVIFSIEERFFFPANVIAAPSLPARYAIMRGRERRYRLSNNHIRCAGCSKVYGHLFECHLEFGCTGNQEKE